MRNVLTWNNGSNWPIAQQRATWPRLQPVGTESGETDGTSCGGLFFDRRQGACTGVGSLCVFRGMITPPLHPSLIYFFLSQPPRFLFPMEICRTVAVILNG